MSAPPPGNARPLAGVRVVELVHMIMGPSCGFILAELGADVVKVEPLEGDNTRRLVGTGAGFFVTFNRGKRSLAVDLKSPDGLAVVRKLLARADVVTENFRPGALDKLGLGCADVHRLNPRAVYCSLKGFLAGPYEHRTALDEVVQMMGGLAYMTGPPGRPLRAGASVNDIMGGMFAAIGILAALRARETTGEGQHVKSGLYENCAFLVSQHMAQAAVTGKTVAPMPARLAAWAIYDVFEASDSKQVFVGVVTDTQWVKFCEAFGRPDLAADKSLATNPQRVHARDRLIPEVATIVKQYDAAALMAKCEAVGLPFAPIAQPEDLFDDPHLNAGGMVAVELPDGRHAKLPTLPLELDGARPTSGGAVPRCGGDTRAVLAELGFAPDAIARLVEARVVAA
jgi:crotonobetainyl-CoA:carnitine CoA-transferase CaiB-like acyl-CoA transferase